MDLEMRILAGLISLCKIPALCAALKDDDEQVRYEATWALYSICDPSASRALTEAADDASEVVRAWAAAALERINKEAIRGGTPSGPPGQP